MIDLARKSGGAITAVLALLLAAPGVTYAQSAHDLYQQALRKERTDGDLKEAIRIYEQVARNTDRALAARALLRIGEAYEKLGRAEALNAYQRLVRDFADQSESVGVARERLSALAAPAAPTRVAATGLSLRRVWHDPGVDMEGQPTPDGRYLTFVDWETGDLAVREVATGQQRLLTKKGYPAYALGSSVSRDGRLVAYLWNTAPPPEEWHAQLRVIGMDGTGERILIDNANQGIDYLTPYEWTPDGSHVLVVLSKQAGNEIALVDTRTGAVRTIKAMDWRLPMRAALSPDGKWIAYDFLTNPDSPSRDIYLLAADGSAEHRLTNHPTNDLHAIWMPNGSELLFSSERGGSVGLWRVRIADGRAVGEPQLVKADMTPGFYPMGFTSAGALFYNQDTGGGDIQTVAFDLAAARVTGEPRTFVQQHQGFNMSAHFSADMSLLAYMSRRDALSIGHNARLVLQDLKTGQERILSVRSQRQYARPRISPDGKHVVLYSRMPRLKEAIQLVDVASGTPRALITMPGEGGLRHPVWSRDGQYVYYFRNDTIDSPVLVPRIVRHHVATGAEQIVHRFDLGNVRDTWALSPDERRIAYAGVERGSRDNRVRIAQLGGTESRELVRIPAPQVVYVHAGITWTPDGRHILYGVERDQRWVGDKTITLNAVPVDGGPPHAAGLALHELRHLSFLPDGKTLAFTSGPISFNEVWVLENLPAPKR